ncbi:MULTISPECIES: hypothetical protein [Acinetobacter]|jgi:hypothetical protein|uniref:Uncharacterized protein n=2 Tax=Acinetobacter TaxID=469 RepID=N9P0R6_9GAMM|nr:MULTISPECIES: hypothetical protein [Acinetobacter]ENX07670.1 hypothetical protein F897_02707 [Acinetobacter variabilis]MCU4628293.1 hypothetical protein [Acinetobacter variabilis]QIC67516.1 hypothetical protein FSC10_09050 [Acinetobacter schindleri]UBI31627.1 hypothetical protein LA331_05600 [Acinetobacter variabilis]
MKVEFQYLAKGADRPDNITLSDAGYLIEQGEPIPSKGDCIMIEICSPIDKRGNFGHFKVIARHFMYSSSGHQQKHMIIVVTDADDTPENNYRE